MAVSWPSRGREMAAAGHPSASSARRRRFRSPSCGPRVRSSFCSRWGPCGPCSLGRSRSPCSLAVYSVLAAFALCALPTVLVVLVAFAGFALVRSPWSWGSMRSSRSLRWMRFVQPPRCMRLSKPARLQQPWHTSTLLRQSLHDGAARAKINTKAPRRPAGRWERTGAAPSFVPTK